MRFKVRFYEKEKVGESKELNKRKMEAEGVFFIINAEVVS